MKKSVIIVFLFWAQVIMANSNSKNDQRILIRVPQAKIQVQYRPQLAQAQINLRGLRASDFSVVRSSLLTEVKPTQGLTKENFLREDKYDPQNLQIEVLSPEAQLEIQVLEGEVQIDKWPGSALVHLQKGKIVSKQGTGNLAIHSQTTEVVIQDHSGRLEMDTYKSRVQISNLNGDAELAHFLGDTNIDKAKGAFVLNQNQGNIKISNGSGSFKFDISKANLSAQKFAGRVEGQSLEGPVSLVLAEDSDINIKSKAGRVTIQSPPNLGASLNLISTEGDIYGPTYLSVNRESGQKSLRGRMKGAAKASVVVRTQEAGIFIR